MCYCSCSGFHLGLFSISLLSFLFLSLLFHLLSNGRIDVEHIFTEYFGKPKVNDFQWTIFILSIKQEILWFKISVANLIAMTVINSHNNLRKDILRLHFREISIINDSVKQLATSAHFHN